MDNFDELEKDIADRKLTYLNDDRFIVGHYYVRAAHDIEKVGKMVASHQSTAAGEFAEDTLLNRCSAKLMNVEYTAGKNEGIIAIAFPIELFGAQIRSSDILHILSGAVQNDESQHYMFYLIDIEIPQSIIETFPGPRYGTTLFSATDKPRLGTIIKPCSGITLKEYEEIVRSLLAFEELGFIKEDENFFPAFQHCPLVDRVRLAGKLIEESGRSVVFAPHITAPPRELFAHLEAVADAGLNAVMFSETYYGGMVREAREYIEDHNLPLAIYAHNGGICTKTKSINRVILDRFSRYDGGDLRQTAPTGELCYLRPLAWQRDLVEKTLQTKQGALKKTINVRAGGLDQGNLLQNLWECAEGFGDYLFLMGSAINSMKDAEGQPSIGMAMTGINQVVELFNRGVRADAPGELYAIAKQEGVVELAHCIEQRYTPEQLARSKKIVTAEME